MNQNTKGRDGDRIIMKQSEIIKAARAQLPDNPAMAAYILRDTIAAQRDDDIYRMAMLLSRDGASVNDVRGLLDDIAEWYADHVEMTQ